MLNWLSLGEALLVLHFYHFFRERLKPNFKRSNGKNLKNLRLVFFVVIYVRLTTLETLQVYKYKIFVASPVYLNPSCTRYKVHTSYGDVNENRFELSEFGILWSSRIILYIISHETVNLRLNTRYVKNLDLFLYILTVGIYQK